MIMGFFGHASHTLTQMCIAELDPFDGVEAIRHSPEYRITGLVGFRSQEVIVLDVDEELGICRIWIISARCSDGPSSVFQSVVGFVRHRNVFVFTIIDVCIVTARLDHKTRNDPVKNQPEVKFLLDQIEKIVDVRGREFGQQFKLNVALRGFDQYAWVLGVRPLRGEPRRPLLQVALAAVWPQGAR